MRLRSLALALAPAALVGTASGCALNAGVGIQFSGGSRVTVTESSESVELDSNRVSGVIDRRRAIGIDCSVSIVYEANDIGGPGVVVQTREVHLRTRRLPRGTAYDLDCAGPLIFELPRVATGIQATAGETALQVQAPVRSVPISFGRRLRPQHGTQLALVRRPDTLPSGDYRIELTFTMPRARPFYEKVIAAASVSCAGSQYVQPLLPGVAKMKGAHGVTIRPSVKAYSLKLPRIAGARENGVPVERTRKLSC
jgi:hypothetical protein